MAPHQNAAKRLKALLRRTHFPVARLRQIRAPSAGGGSDGGGGHRAVNSPWASIVEGDPRAALIVLHWTLLDMSPVFSSNLLDRGYAGLQSLTDYKFVSKGLRMLREEFDCRPQLTAEQFLTQGFAEVKMRLLADVVEIVIRTHMSLARLQGGSSGHSPNVSQNVDVGHSRNGSQNFDCDNGNHVVSSWSGSLKPPVSVEADPSTGAACGWGIKSDGGGGSGTSSPFPWATPRPIPQQSSCLQSFGSRARGGEYTATSPRPLSPLLFRGTPFDVVDCSSGGGNSFVRHPSIMSTSPLSDEQNAPPDEGEAIQHRMPLRAPVASVHTPVPRDHHWYAGSSSALKYTGDSDTGAGSAAERKGSCMWLGDPEPLKGLREAVLQASRRSPLEPRAAPQESIHDNTIPEVNPPEATAFTSTVPSLPVAPHQASGPGSVVDGKGRSDWHAVQQAFGSFGESHVPFPSPEVVPMIPSAEHGVSKLLQRAVSSAVAHTTSAPSASILAGVSTIRGGDGGRGCGAEEATKNPAGRDCARLGCPVDGSDCCALSEEGESRGGSGDAGDGFGNRQQRQQHGQEGDGLMVVELLGNMQRQIEAMLEQHTRSLEEKIKETEQALSARLTILETKVHRLELGSPVRS